MAKTAHVLLSAIAARATRPHAFDFPSLALCQISRAVAATPLCLFYAPQEVHVTASERGSRHLQILDDIVVFACVAESCYAYRIPRALSTTTIWRF